MTTFTLSISFSEQILDTFPIEELISAIQQAFQNINERFPGFAVVTVNFDEITLILTVVIEIDPSVIPEGGNQVIVVREASSEIKSMFPGTEVNIVNNTTGEEVPTGGNVGLILGIVALVGIGAVIIINR